MSAPPITSLLDALTSLPTARSGPAFDPRLLTFPSIGSDEGAQRGFVLSEDKRNVALCPRRTGKTTGTAIRLLKGARTAPFANQGYVTLSLKNAKRLVWPVVKRLNTHYDLGGIANESDGSMRFPRLENEPAIYLGGAKDSSEIEKLRGWADGVKAWVVDEAASFRQLLLRMLIDEVIEPSLFDYDGSLDVIGSPGPVRAGFFFDITAGKQQSEWRQHHWTMHDNTFLQKKSGKSPAQMLAELLARRGWTPSHPTFRREYLGEWVEDPDALLFHYDQAKNAGEFAGPRDGWMYVLGFDLGYDDSDAIAVIGWPRGSRDVHLVFESVVDKQTLTPMAEDLGKLIALYRPIRAVGDFGGLGKKIGEEWRQRFSMPIEAADKNRKAEHIALLDDAMQTGRFKAHPASRFAQDCAIMTWDAEQKAKGVFVADDRAHSDILDAALYAFRHALAHFETPIEAPPADEGLAMRQRRAQLIEERKNGDRQWWEDAAVGLGIE